MQMYILLLFQLDDSLSWHCSYLVVGLCVAIIIAHTPEGKQQGSTNVAVGAIADYLESIGY